MVLLLRLALQILHCFFVHVFRVCSRYHQSLELIAKSLRRRLRSFGNAAGWSCITVHTGMSLLYGEMCICLHRCFSQHKWHAFILPLRLFCSELLKPSTAPSSLEQSSVEALRMMSMMTLCS